MRGPGWNPGRGLPQGRRGNRAPPLIAGKSSDGGGALFLCAAGSDNWGGKGLSNEVTKEDLTELKRLIENGFKGVHDRQDVTNGRVQKGEIEQARADVRMTNVEREVFRRQRETREDAEIADARQRRDD